MYENNAVAVELLKVAVPFATKQFFNVVNLAEPTFPCAMCRDSLEIQRVLQGIVAARLPRRR